MAIRQLKKRVVELEGKTEQRAMILRFAETEEEAQQLSEKYKDSPDQVFILRWAEEL